MAKDIGTAINHYRPALLLSRLVHGRFYNLLRFGLLVLMLISLGMILYRYGSLYFLSSEPTLATALAMESLFAGIGMLAAALYIVLRAFSFYFNSEYYRGVPSVYQTEPPGVGITYEVALIIRRQPIDLTAALFKSKLGKKLALRLGLSDEVRQEFLARERTPVSFEAINLSTDKLYTFIDLANDIKKSDQVFQEFLTQQGVTDEIFSGAVTWTNNELIRAKQKERWWSRDNLSLTHGIGGDFAYGIAYELKKYTKSPDSAAIFSESKAVTSYGGEYIDEIETILARTDEANVLLVGEPGVGKMDLLMAVNERMENGQALGAVVGKRMVVLDNESLLSQHESKTKLEQTLIKLFKQAAAAGNLIVVIDGVDQFMESAKALEVDVPSLMDEYLSDPDLHVIATTDPTTYHREIATEGGFLRRFETVLVEAPTNEVTIKLLETLVADYEADLKINFSYDSVASIAKGADRYLVEGVMPDKAVHLLDEVATAAKSAQVSLVRKDLVEKYVAEKTGVPVGPIAEDERSALLQLEEILHKRMVGQERAIEAVSGVMRRSRAGLHDESKPIGSFLFLGPTGVGKTEMAKTLAEAFFETEEAMHRLDMSEFSGGDALARLIGGEGQPRALSSMLKEHPYSVLLLDEFEKASEEVHDLFLQVLDEGMFTDGLGQKINARNTIIIATSNAGSQQIIAWLDAGVDLNQKQEEIVDYVVKEGIYKPELVNRFDGVVMFEPLREEQIAQIAKAMLAKLSKRLEDRGYKLEITDDLVNTLVRLGYQPEFGARPMQRAIQNVVEEAAAEKIISGSLKKGDTIRFTKQELAKLV